MKGDRAAGCSLGLVEAPRLTPWPSTGALHKARVPKGPWCAQGYVEGVWPVREDLVGYEHGA